MTCVRQHRITTTSIVIVSLSCDMFFDSNKLTTFQLSVRSASVTVTYVLNLLNTFRFLVDISQMPPPKRRIHVTRTQTGKLRKRAPAAVETPTAAPDVAAPDVAAPDVAAGTAPLADAIAAAVMRQLEQSGRLLPASVPEPVRRLAEAVPRASRLAEAVPRASRLAEAIPRASRLAEAVPRASRLAKAVPRASRLAEAVPRASRLAEAVPSASTSRNVVGADSDDSDQDDIDAVLSGLLGDRQSTTDGTVARCRSGQDSRVLETRSVATLEHDLIRASLAPTTRASYRRSVNMLRQYLSSVHPGVRYFPVSRTDLAGFITHLFAANYAFSTILSTVSAISYSHKIVGLPDPADNFYIRKLLVGVHKTSRTMDLRRPIDQHMLALLVRTAQFFPSTLTPPPLAWCCCWLSYLWAIPFSFTFCLLHIRYLQFRHTFNVLLVNFVSLSSLAGSKIQIHS